MQDFASLHVDVFLVELLHEDLLAVVDVDAAGGSLDGLAHQVVVLAVGLLCGLDLLDSRGAVLMSGHEDDQTLAGIVHLVVDDLLDILLGLLLDVPGIALCPDGGGAVVEQVIEHTAVAIVHKRVVAGVEVLGLGVLDLAQVDVRSAGGHGDAPQATFHPVALHVDVGATAAVIDADAAAAVIGVGLVAVVDHHIVLDDGVPIPNPQSPIPIAFIFFNNIVNNLIFLIKLKLH